MQKREWLPDIVSGDMTFALGYTEPNAGTDLASLQTRAVRDGDEWVINGQKIYGGFGSATHGWLAARTDPDAPKHQGISVFIFPTNVPGITVRPMGTMGRIITSETFFDNVRLPADTLFGELNRGWYYMSNALDLERVMIEPQSLYQRRVDALVSHIEDNRPELMDDPVVRTRLAEATVDSQVSRALAMTNAIMVQNGITPTMEGAMVKVWGSEARYPRRQPRPRPARPRRRPAPRERGGAGPREARGELPRLLRAPLRRGHQRRAAPHRRDARPRAAERVGDVTMAMDLRLSDLQELIRDSADDFLEREAPASRMRQIEWAGEPDAELWSQMVELGWTGLPIAEEHGGQDAQSSSTSAC